MLRIVTVKFVSRVQLCGFLQVWTLVVVAKVEAEAGSHRSVAFDDFFLGRVLSNRNFAGGVGDAVASCRRNGSKRECGL